MLPQRVSERLEALRGRPITADEKGFSFLGGATAASIATARPPLHEAWLLIRCSPCARARWTTMPAPWPRTARRPALNSHRTARSRCPPSWPHCNSATARGRLPWPPSASSAPTAATAFLACCSPANSSTRPAIALLAAELAAHPDFEPYCFADNPKTVENYIRTSPPASPHHALSVLIELGHDGGRTYCRTDAEAIEVAKAVAGSEVLRLAGVAAFEAASAART